MTQDCKVCLAQHDEEIHAATNRVHTWFRSQVTQDLQGAPDDSMLSEGAQLGAPRRSAA